MKRKLKNIMLVVSVFVFLFMLYVGVSLYEIKQNEKLLDSEFAEIEYLINRNGILDSSIDIKLDNYVTGGEYLKVEMAIKEYLKDMLEEYRNLRMLYDDEQLNMVLYFSNFEIDAPYFENSLQILSDTRNNIKNIESNLNNLFDEEIIMNYAEDYNLDGFYLTYFRNSLIDSEAIAENKGDISDTVNYIIAVLDAYDNYFSFLSSNSNYWTMDKHYIYFENDELLEEYNILLYIINNIEFVNDLGVSI